MSKYAGIVIGVIVLLLGIRGICCWGCDFLTVLRGTVPAMMILGGAIAVIAGISQIKEESSSKTEGKK